MLKRIGKCRRCGNCCRHFSIISSQVSDFMRAKEELGLRLIFLERKQGVAYYKCNMLDKNNLCKVYRKRPLPCKEFPRSQVPKEWSCGYKFIPDNRYSKAWKERQTKKTFRFFEKLKRTSR